MNCPIEKSITIQAPAHTVWAFLTEPARMIQWMGEPEMDLQIITSWAVGQPVLIKGFHHVTFEARGMVMQCEPGHRLQYSQVSSVSGLPDAPESYSVLTFELKPANETTQLTLHIENFPTETIYKHLDFYWQGTLDILKNAVENRDKA